MDFSYNCIKYEQDFVLRLDHDSRYLDRGIACFGPTRCQKILDTYQNGENELDLTHILDFTCISIIERFIEFMQDFTVFDFHPQIYELPALCQISSSLQCKAFDCFLYQLRPQETLDDDFDLVQFLEQTISFAPQLLVQKEFLISIVKLSNPCENEIQSLYSCYSRISDYQIRQCLAERITLIGIDSAINTLGLMEFVRIFLENRISEKSLHLESLRSIISLLGIFLYLKENQLVTICEQALDSIFDQEKEAILGIFSIHCFHSELNLSMCLDTLVSILKISTTYLNYEHRASLLAHLSLNLILERIERDQPSPDLLMRASEFLCYMNKSQMNQLYEELNLQKETKALIFFSRIIRLQHRSCHIIRVLNRFDIDVLEEQDYITVNRENSYPNEVISNGKQRDTCFIDDAKKDNVLLVRVADEVFELPIKEMHSELRSPRYFKAARRFRLSHGDNSEFVDLGIPSEFIPTFSCICKYTVHEVLDVDVNEFARVCLLSQYLLFDEIFYDLEIALEHIADKEDDVLLILSQWKYYGGNWLTQRMLEHLSSILCGSKLDHDFLAKEIVLRLHEEVTLDHLRMLLCSESAKLRKSVAGNSLLSKCIMHIYRIGDFIHFKDEEEFSFLTLQDMKRLYSMYIMGSGSDALYSIIEGNARKHESLITLKRGLGEIHEDFKDCSRRGICDKPINIPKYTKLQITERYYPRDLLFLKDSYHLLSLDETGHLRCLDPIAGDQEIVYQHDSAVTGFSIAANDCILSSSLHGLLVMTDINQCKSYTIFQSEYEFSSLIFSSTYNMTVLSGRNRISLWDSRASIVIHSFRTSSIISNLDTQGQLLATAQRDGAQVFDLRKLQDRNSAISQRYSSAISKVALHPHKRELASMDMSRSLLYSFLDDYKLDFKVPGKGLRSRLGIQSDDEHSISELRFSTKSDLFFQQGDFLSFSDGEVELKTYRWSQSSKGNARTRDGALSCFAGESSLYFLPEYTPNLKYTMEVLQ